MQYTVACALSHNQQHVQHVQHVQDVQRVHYRMTSSMCSACSMCYAAQHIQCNAVHLVDPLLLLSVNVTTIYIRRRVHAVIVLLMCVCEVSVL